LLISHQVFLIFFSAIFRFRIDQKKGADAKSCPRRKRREKEEEIVQVVDGERRTKNMTGMQSDSLCR
jgi:hypothetical protein